MVEWGIDHAVVAFWQVRIDGNNGGFPWCDGYFIRFPSRPVLDPEKGSGGLCGMDVNPGEAG